MFVLDTVRGPLHDCKNKLLMHNSGIVSDSMCPPHSLGSLLRKHLNRRKKARYSIPSIMHAHATPWPIREEPARFSSLRRRRKLCLRSNHLLAAMGSSPGSTSRRRRGQSLRPTSGHQRGCSVTPGLTAQDPITSELGYDTGVHDSVQGSWFIIFMYGSPFILAQGQVWGSVEAKLQQFQRPFNIM
ncbi:hypothetical protein LOK49_LG10G02487 [Camellia lanceoleosa]|uniref:Uncharacterized protein n=1 Tax=Camellia lanceoleosa TaxID=1840588 RepID=A0ACC0GF69_9ERIC|nr:hypothetical protein LOK49_LG10G02487 [Camellia lanceoleosa]